MSLSNFKLDIICAFIHFKEKYPSIILLVSENISNSFSVKQILIMFLVKLVNEDCVKSSESIAYM